MIFVEAQQKRDTFGAAVRVTTDPWSVLKFDAVTRLRKQLYLYFM